MKAQVHKITAYFVDTENMGIANIKEIISMNKYLPMPSFTLAETVEVKEWSDEHPANLLSTNMDDWWDKQEKH